MTMASSPLESVRMARLGSSAAATAGSQSLSRRFCLLSFLFLWVACASAAGTWSQQAFLPPLVANSTEGYSVALSADGNTLAVGSIGYNTTYRSNSAGFVQVYVRVGTTWSHQATLSQEIADSNEGTSLALSANGDLLVVGAPSFPQCGAVQLYTRSGSTWAYNGSIKTICPYGEADFGYSVSVSAAGDVLAVGAPYAGLTDEGCTVIYALDVSVWVPVATLTQNAMFGYEGYSVSLSGDGSTLIAGVPCYGFGNTERCGASAVYVASGSTWIHQANLTQSISFAYEGASVSISYDGNFIAAGAPARGPDRLRQASTEGVSLYFRTGNIWYPSDFLTSAPGVAVALAANGTILASAQLYGWPTIFESPPTWNQTFIKTIATSLSLSANAKTLALGNAGFGTSIWTIV